MIPHGTKIKLFAGNSNPVLAKRIADALGLTLSDCVCKKFADGEISVSFNETVRGCDVFLIQSTCCPVNDNFMELLIMIDACRRASAGRITAVMPYFGYARQDRKAKARDPISAKLCAEMLEAAGADRVLTMDLHANQIQGFFNIPVDNLLGTKILTQYFYDRLGVSNPDYVVVSPDLGSVTRVRKFTDKLDLPMAIVDKRRPKPNVSEVMNIIGDVRDKHVILVDDMVDTAGTLCNGAKALVERGGAKSVTACATHGVLSGPAIERLQASVIDKLVLLDTIPVEGEKAIDKIETLSVADLFAEAIRRIYDETAISDLYN
ncbi:MAG: ribose-phosphate pyrophosphokinase [Clostridiaceae bacterium]|nr:ribose-phosphate pyrophosphokinase [Clostridia bacterium]MDD7310870.1 ribose-phosphate pyrophosphokinase [Clostridia bacterium]MDY3870505.1 ribose-phosphate pyrophosphokinase [Clostridiaceae bacterium]